MLYDSNDITARHIGIVYAADCCKDCFTTWRESIFSSMSASYNSI